MDKDMIIKRMKALQILKAVEDIVSPVWLVGGSVRDILLEREPKDFDMTTPVLPDDIEAKIRAAGRKPYLTGKRFGTIGVKVEVDKRFYYVEVTTHRREQYEPNSRKPIVEFINDLTLDQSRRDYTVNAIAMASDGILIDPFSGRLDILAHKIKAVGEATDRFKEDPLRMLRGARFVAQLGFDLDPNVVGKIRKMSHTITSISRERWTQELDKLLVSQQPEDGIDVLYKTHLLKYMLPEVQTVYENSELRENLQSNVLLARNAHEAWGALLMEIGKPYAARKGRYDQLIYPHHEKIGLELVRGICSRLKFSNERTAIVEETMLKQRRSS